MSELPKLKNKLQEIFNQYIRLRDLQGDFFQCISCRQIKDKSQMNAGHYYNVGQHDGLRYNEDNVHGQCIRCNKYLNGNLIEYSKHLKEKLGPQRFQQLELLAGYYRRNGHKWSRFELQEKIRFYKKLVKELLT